MNGSEQQGVVAHGFAAEEPGGALVPRAVEIGKPGPGEVVVRISHCGLCASDVVLIDDAHHAGGFPMTLGHEIAGAIELVGPDVDGLKVGDRVGIGPLRYSCGTCVQCVAGREVHCAEIVMTAAPHGQGGFADRIRIDARFAFRLPDSIASEHAAALMCAGLTTYAPLRRLARAGDRVGVLGVGGLGHLAIMFAVAMGCRVTTLALSPTMSERGEHLALGADTVIDVTDLDALRSITGTIDLLLSTAYGTVRWRRLMHCLAPEGVLCVVGGSEAPLDLSPITLIHHQRTVTGSAAGSRRDMAQMLEFAAATGVIPKIETMPMAAINDGIQRFRQGLPRYRLVFDV